MIMNKNKTIIIAGAVCLAVALASFFGGMAYGQSRAAAAKTANGAVSGQFGNGQRGPNGAFRQGGNRGVGPGFVSGDILSKDAQSVTIKMRDGSTKIVLLAPSTQIGKMAAGTADDLVAGEAVTVNGTANPDGSVTAQSIQIRPAQPNEPAQPPTLTK